MSVGSDILRAENIAKHFGAVTALVDVSLRLGRGEVLGLIGDNGAGKSTLVKILAGFQQPDAGRLLVNGDPVALRSVAHARSLGIETVYQDLALVKELSVYENMFLGRELVSEPPQRRAGASAATHASDGRRVPGTHGFASFLAR